MTSFVGQVWRFHARAEKAGLLLYGHLIPEELGNDLKYSQFKSYVTKSEPDVITLGIKLRS